MNENVNICITPKGDKPVLHFSQFDNERVFTVTVLADDGESAAVLTGLDIEFRLRKTDSHVVTIAPESVADNVITFKTTEQLCACCGQNIASVVLMDSEMIVSTLDILVDIQRDILSGGLTSESDIRNLTTQIETIIPEVLADDYYTKTEVDELIDDIPTFDPTNYYDKSDVDGLLADKADLSDLPDMSDYYTKGETNTLLLDKADKSDVYTKAQTDSLLFFKVDKINEKTAAGLPAAIASFNDAGNDCPLSVLTVGVVSGSSDANIVCCGKNFFNPASILKGTYDASTNTWSTITGSQVKAFDFVFKPDTQYTFSGIETQSEINKNARLVIRYTDNTSENIFADNGTVPTSFTKTSASGKSIDFVYYGYGSSSTNGVSIQNFQIECNTSASSYEPFKGNIANISFGTTLTQAGVLNCISGLLTLEDESTIQCTGVEIDTATGLNYVYCDTGDILTLKYFGFNAEELFRYIRLIKG